MRLWDEQEVRHSIETLHLGLEPGSVHAAKDEEAQENVYDDDHHGVV